MKNNDGKLLSIAFILQVVTFIISMVKVKVLTNLLTTDDYGIYSVMINTMGFLIFAVFFGLDRYLVKEKDEQKRVIILKTLYLVLISISIITFLFISILNIQVDKSINMFIIGTLLLGVSQINRFYIYAKDEIAKYNYLGFIMNNGWVIILIIFYIIMKPKELSLQLLFVMMIFGNIISIIYSANLIPKSLIKIKIKKSVIKKGLRYSVPLLPTVYANFILRLADKYTLMFLAGNTILGNYNVALSIMNIILAFVTVCIEIYRPRIIQDKDEDKVKGYVTNSVAIILLLCIPAIIVTTVFGQDIVILFSSKKYIEASSIMGLTSLLALIICVVNIIVTLMERTGKNKFVFKSYLKGTLYNIFLNIVLVYFIGMYGAVLAGLISYTYIYISIANKVEFKKYIVFKKIKPILVINAIFTVFVIAVTIIKINFIIQMVILVTIYLALTIIFSKDLIIDLFKK